MVYDGGSPNRPVSMTGLVLANGTFTATFDYTSAFGDALVSQQAITGSTDAIVLAAMQGQLNLTRQDSSVTLAFISVTNPAPFGNASNFQGAVLTDIGNGPSDWTVLNPGSQPDTSTTQPTHALVTFTAVPGT